MDNYIDKFTWFCVVVDAEHYYFRFTLDEIMTVLTLFDIPDDAQISYGTFFRLKKTDAYAKSFIEVGSSTVGDFNKILLALNHVEG